VRTALLGQDAVVICLGAGQGELACFCTEYADALGDANQRVRALEADIEEREKRAKTRELWLASPRASAYSVRRSDSSWWPADLDSAD
jgi:hypothetical protein